MRRMSSVWWLALLAALALGAAGAQDLAPEARRVSLQAQAMPLAEALTKVVEQAGLRLAVVGATLPTEPVDLALREVTLAFALEQLLTVRGLEYQIMGQMLAVKPAAQRAEPRAGQPQRGQPPVGLRPGGLPPAAGTVPATTPAPVAPPANAALSALPKPVVDGVHTLLRAAFDQPANRRAALAVGWRLRELRPDWREALVRAMPAWWSSWDATPAAALRGARLFASLGEARPAATLAGEASRSAELRAQALVALAELALVSGDPSEAYSRLRQAGNGLDDDPRAAALAAMARYQLGDTMLAMTDATLAATRWPRDAGVLAAYGELLRLEGNAGGASVALQDALRHDPEQPDALYGAAALAADDGGDPSATWESFVADEPFSLRSARVRLGVTTTRQTLLWDRGGQIWDISADGDRVLYSDAFRNQLQATDVHGHGLATQLTDQETAKTWATWSPDEEHLAWIVGNALWMQKTNASGAHHQVLTAEGDKVLRCTTWTPDGRLLLVTEQDPRGRASRLRAYDWEAGQEVPPPPPLNRAGLGDARCLSDGAVVATLINEDRQAVVLLAADGALLLLRPWASTRTYTAPVLDNARDRVMYYDESTDALMVAPADGTHGTALALTSATLGRGARGALFSPISRTVAMSAGGSAPTRLDLDGLNPAVTLRCAWLADKATGPEPPRLRFDAMAPPPGASLTLVAIDDDGREVGAKTAPLSGTVEYRPEPSTPGPHWVKATVTIGGRAEAPRWYSYAIAPTN